MNQKLFIISTFILSVVLVSPSESKQFNLKAHTLRKSNPYKKGHLLVRLKNGIRMQQAAAMHQSMNVKVLKTFQYPRGLQLVKLPEDISVEKALSVYKNNPYIAYVEPDYLVHTQIAPSDTKWLEQWALNNVGQTNGKVDADINAPEMWEHSVGKKEIVLGVIDTGILYRHPDLAANVWSNSEEIPENRIDDDANGFVDDIHGINAITKTGNPLDDNSHGTHVSGIMGAVGDNSEGIVGINQKVSILGCKFLDAGGGGATSDALTCMDYMLKLKTRAKNPVNIVATNNSWAGGGYSQAMVDAIEAHRDAGILFMAASSNEGNNNDEVKTYPANYPVANIISVAASDHNDELAYFSNYGSRSVHVTAPGADILSTVIGNKYEAYSGTSMATPHVTGMAGLIKAYNPELDWKAIKNLIISSGQPIAAAKGKTISGRRLKGAGEDGTGALTCLDQTVLSVLAPKAKNMMIKVGKSVDFSIMHINCANPNGVPSVMTNVEGFELKDDGIDFDDVANDGIYSARWMPVKGGRYSFNLGVGENIDITVYNPLSWHKYKSLSDVSHHYRKIQGTKLSLGDDSSAAVTSDFPIAFAGDGGGFTVLYVNSNGTISFTDATASSWTNKNLPVENTETFIAPFWDDLNPSLGEGGVFYEVIGEAPNRELVVEWRNVEHFYTKDTLKFQVVFFENNSDILFNYADVMLNNPSYDKGVSATIGIQTSETLATMIGFNQSVLENNLSILFTAE